VIKGRWIDPEAAKMPFKQYAAKWMKRRSEDPRKPLAETTKAKYQRLLDDYVFEEFGHHQLGQIKSSQVQDWYDGIAHLHPSTAAGAYRLLATIYNTAVSDDVIARSPCKVEGGSREEVKDRPTMTQAELETAILATDERLRLAVLLAAWGQLRRGEILGLQRGDIALTRGTVKIEREWLLTATNDTIVKDHPKTEAGKRTLHMPSNVREAMTAHLANYTRPEPDAWLFERNGWPVHPRTFERAWVRARNAAGRPDVHFHDLRVTGLTWAAQEGATIAELMRRAGHKSPAAAMRYQQAEDARDKSLADALGQRALSGGSHAS
jgi:integrase